MKKSDIKTILENRLTTLTGDALNQIEPSQTLAELEPYIKATETIHTMEMLGFISTSAKTELRTSLRKKLQQKRAELSLLSFK